VPARVEMTNPWAQVMLTRSVIVGNQNAAAAATAAAAVAAITSTVTQTTYTVTSTVVTTVPARTTTELGKRSRSPRFVQPPANDGPVVRTTTATV
jgi:hypothetical protein